MGVQGRASENPEEGHSRTWVSPAVSWGLHFKGKSMILGCLGCLGMHFDSIFDPQIGPKSTPGGLLGRLWAVWDRLLASWGGLGASWERHGVS